MPDYDGNELPLSKTDWYLPKEYPRDYWWNIVQPIVQDLTCKEMFREFQCDIIEISNFWFLQYLNLDSHPWHTHGHAHWTNVYYVELPSTELNTEIVDITRKNQLVLDDVREGDIISFPAMLYHKSPINKTNERKTIISFNISID